jgi:hypothetical protein
MFQGSNAKVVEFSKFIDSFDFNSIVQEAASENDVKVNSAKRELGIPKMFKPHVEVALCQKFSDVKHFGPKLKLLNTYETGETFLLVGCMGC